MTQKELQALVLEQKILSRIYVIRKVCVMPHFALQNYVKLYIIQFM
jgi:hypothetical protein